MTGWIRPDAVFDGTDLRAGIALRFAAGRVAALVPESELGAADRVQAIPGILSPLLVEIQVNGGGGVLFNTSATPDGIAAIIAAHRNLGTGWLMPTVITDAPEVMERAADAVLAAWGMPGLGIHVEGPHIAVDRRGTHDARFIRPLDARTLAVVQRLRAAEVPVLLTLAPEAVMPGQIASLAAMGVTVSLGHSNADQAAVQDALDEGAGAFTHLFNAMSPMEGRAPGMVGTAILSRAHVGIICDGIHVSDDMAGLRSGPGRCRAAPSLSRMPCRRWVYLPPSISMAGPSRSGTGGWSTRQGRLRGHIPPWQRA